MLKMGNRIHDPVHPNYKLKLDTVQELDTNNP